VALTQQQKDLLFLRETRQAVNTVGRIDYKSGVSGAPMFISKVGFLAKLIIKFKGTVTCSHASKTTFSKAADAPWAIIKNIGLKMNGGVGIWNTTGFGAYLRNLLDVRNNTLDSIVAGRDVFEFGNTVSVGGTANALKFTLELPIQINDRDPVGLLMLQSDKVVCQLDVAWDVPAVLMTDTDITTTVTGSLTVTTEVFEIPDNEDARPDPRLLHVVEEDQIPLVGTGKTRYTFRPGKIHQRAIFRILINGAAANEADILDMALVYNQNKTPYSVDADILRYLNRKRYGRDLPAGVYVWDWGYQGIPMLGNGRDYVNTAKITEFWNVVNIASGAVFGTNNNIIQCVTEALEPMKVA